MLFGDDEDRSVFIWLLGSVVARFQPVCHAYCLMGTHYHVVLECSCARLSQIMSRLNSLYAQGFNRRHKRRGHLFESRYSAYVIRDEAHLEAARAYVAANPVRAGLCATVGEWPWAGVATEPKAGTVPMPTARCAPLTAS